MSKAEVFLFVAWGNWLALAWAMLLGFPFAVSPWVPFWVFLFVAVVAYNVATGSKRGNNENIP